jgi:hypothetical protein
MSTIRPLATIAVLAVLGLFLAWQINQPGPVALQENWGELAPIDGAPAAAEQEAPPFSPSAALATGEASATPRSAPPTQDTAPAARPNTADTTPSSNTGGLSPLPELPAAPAKGVPVIESGSEGVPLEGLDPTAPLASPATAPATERQAAKSKPVAAAALALPALPALAAKASAPPSGQSAPAVSGRVPSLGTATPDLPPMPTPIETAASSAAPTPPSVASTTEPQSLEAPASIAVGDRYATVAPSSVPDDVPDFGADRYAESETTPLRFGAKATPPDTAPPAATPAPPAATPASKSAAPAAGFATAWPMIQEALARNELTRAHLMLSQWRDDPSLTLEQRNEVLGLLDQLAGTVVYSTDHLLEPPHQVAPGETLVTIAQRYGVPWTLLAKINGVATPEGVQPGQTLKVVRGPFHAQVDANTGELVLLVDGRYAGRFPASVEGAASTGGAWTVGEKAPSGLVLRSDAAPGATVALGAEPAPTAAGRIAVATADALELNDILSVGSTVTVRR